MGFVINCFQKMAKDKGDVMSENPRVNVTFDPDTYDQIKLIADKNNKSMSEVVRDWTMLGLNGTLAQQNLDVLTPILREQLKSIIDPAVERLATMNAKTCVQAGAAAYLSAEAISKFVPVKEQEEFLRAYEGARKKAVHYLRGTANLE